MSKISMFGLHTAEIAGYAKLSFQNKWNYCKKNNIQLTYSFSALDDRPASWSKIPFLLNNTWDWALWVDADAWIVDENFDFSNLIDENFDIILSKREGEINMGIFIIRNCEFTQKLLKTLDGMAEFYDHKWWEQGAMIKLMKKDKTIREHIKFVDDSIFNCSLEKVNPDTVILHLAGCNNEGRCAKFNELSKSENEIVNL